MRLMPGAGCARATAGRHHDQDRSHLKQHQDRYQKRTLVRTGVPVISGTKEAECPPKRNPAI